MGVAYSPVERLRHLTDHLINLLRVKNHDKSVLCHFFGPELCGGIGWDMIRLKVNK
jgi:hypothetical protein